MTAQVIPPKPNQINSTDLLNWHEVFKPDFGTLASLGYIDGVELLSFGSTIDGLATTDDEVMFFGGASGVRINGLPDPLSADTVYVVSDNAADTQEVTLKGLDANNNWATATATLTGTTPVAVSGTWNSVERIISSGADNVGAIYVSTKATAGAPTTIAHQIQCIIPAKVANTLPQNYGINPIMTCAADSACVIRGFDFSCAANDGVTVRIYANREGRWIINFELFIYQNQFTQRFYNPITLFAGDTLAVMVEREAGVGVKAAFGMNGVVMTRVAPPNDILGGINAIFEEA
jgi:hypothetical protein